MLNEKAKAVLKAFKIDVEKLIAAIKDEKEVELELPEGAELFTKEELEKRDKSQADAGYKKGKQAGEEMLLDELKKTEALEYEGKTKENFLTAIKTKYEGEKGKEVDQKIKDRDNTIKTLKETLSKKEQEFEQVQQQFSGFKSDFEFMQVLPENRNPALNNQEWIYRLKSNGITIEEAEGKKVVRLNGTIISDSKTNEPLPVVDAISSVFKSKEGWLKAETGAGGAAGGGKGRGFGDNNGAAGNGVFKTLSEFKKTMDAEGIQFTNQAYQAKLNEAVKANPEMDMNA